jgi:broad specificity phosphatase PhoE
VAAPSQRPTIYFLRHGETDWNAAGRLQGQLDLPLNAVGERQAAAAAVIHTGLAATGVATTDVAATSVAALDYVASPLVRARRTMEIARVAMALPPDGYRVDEGLKEMSFGTWEGLTLKEVRQRWPADFAARENGKWRYATPSGESYADLAARVSATVETLQRDTVMVAHGGVARVLLALLAGLAPAAALRCPIWQGRVLVLRDGTFAWSRLTPASAAPPPG